MDTPSLIIGLVLLIFFAGPVLHSIWQTKRQEKKELKVFEAIALLNQLKITHSEVLNSSIIGMDTDGHKLLYYSVMKDGKPIIRLVDLRGLLDCKIEENAQIVKEQKGRTRKVIWSISLKFEFLGRGSEEILLFDARKTLCPNGEGPFAVNWSELINRNYKLSTKPVERRKSA